MRTVTLNELAALTGGRIVGNGETSIHDALPLQDASEGCVTLADEKVSPDVLSNSAAAAVVVAAARSECRKPLLVVEDVHHAFQLIITHLRPLAARESTFIGIHPQAHLDPSATLGDDCQVDAGVIIGANCRIGERCRLHAGVHIGADCVLGDDCEVLPNAVLYRGSRLGARVLVHAGAVLGAFGFGYRQSEGRHLRTAQLGWVEIGDDVEIGACSTIDRGTYGPTRIGQGTKIDNQVQIGHNCHIGQHNLICSQVGIAGSTSTGDHVVLAGQVGLADHIHLADRVVVGAQSGVMSDMEAGEVVLGTPALPRKQMMQQWAIERRLPEMRAELKRLQHQLDRLTASCSPASGLRKSA